MIKLVIRTEVALLFFLFDHCNLFQSYDATLYA